MSGTPRRDRQCVNCGDRTMRGSWRCAACSWADETGTRGLVSRIGRVPATCWCEDTTVWITRQALYAGLTRSCGLPECQPIAA